MARVKSLTLDRIMGAAVSVADAEGLKAVTMRRVASELGVEAMSLYHHVPNKSALLEELVATIIGEVSEAIGDSDETDWRAELRKRCFGAREIILRHPWAPGLIGSRTTIPASIVFYYEGILGLLIEGGFSYALAHRALHALGSMPLGFVQELFSPDATGGSLDVGAANSELHELAATLPYMAEMLRSEIHANDGNTLGWCDSRAEFEFTLDLLLDGLERQRRSAASRH